jgi:hypothetical protein
MLRKRNEAKRKSIAMTLMRDLQGSAAQKLAMFEKVRAAGRFAKEDPADLAEAEKMLRAFVAVGERRVLRYAYRRRYKRTQSEEPAH